MKYETLSEDMLIYYIGGGCEKGSRAFEGCQAELNRRLANKSVDVSKRALWISIVSAGAALCSAIVSIAQLFN
jgi:hypothetical protein